MNQTFFFYKICQAPNLYSTSRVLPIEFNYHKFSFVRYVFVEIFGVFLGMTRIPQKISKSSQF